MRPLLSLACFALASIACAQTHLVTLAWARNCADPAGNSMTPGAMTVDSAGNAYMVGEITPSGLPYQWIVSKYDPNGALLWRKSATTGSSNTVPTVITVAPNGNIAIGGTKMSGGAPIGHAIILLDNKGNVRTSFEQGDLLLSLSYDNSSGLRYVGNLTVGSNHQFKGAFMSANSTTWSFTFDSSFAPDAASTNPFGNTLATGAASPVVSQGTAEAAMYGPLFEARWNQLTNNTLISQTLTTYKYIGAVDGSNLFYSCRNQTVAAPGGTTYGFQITGFDHAGNIRWNYSGTGSYSLISAADEQDLYLYGVSATSQNVISKYNAQGSAWSQPVTTKLIAPDGVNGVAYGDDTGGAGDVHVAKLDTAGNADWATVYPGIAHVNALSSVRVANGYVYIFGTMKANANAPAQLFLVRYVQGVALSGISTNVLAVTGGTAMTGKVILNGPAPAAGLAVKLASANPAVAVPSSATVTTGNSFQTFPISTSPVDKTLQVLLAASANGVGRTTYVYVYPAKPATVVLASPSVTGGSPDSGTVTLNGKAGPSGVVVNLKSSNAVATVPPSVTVPAGMTQANFNITTQAVLTTQTSTITVTANGGSASATLTITH